MGCDSFQFGNICMHDRCPLSLFPIINYHVKKIIFKNEQSLYPVVITEGEIKFLKLVYMFLIFYLFIQLTWF